MTAYITEIGKVFIENCDDIEIANAIFLNQVKRFQLWNPTIDDKYKEYKIRPYYLLLEVLIRLKDHYFTKYEYVLFITKIKTHYPKHIKDQIKLIEEFRELEPEKKKEYIEEINFLDKKKYRKRARTNYLRLLDSAPKEIACYGYGGIIQQGEISCSYQVI